MEHKGVTAFPGDFACHVGTPADVHIPHFRSISDFRERQARLANVIAGEVVPRLMLIHQRAHREPDAPGAADIAEFAQLSMAADNEDLSAYFQRLRDDGHSLDTLFVHFLAPTARYLGELWQQDLCDFCDVTIGVGRLQELLTLFGTADDPDLVDLDHRALLLTVPGEKHVFGIDMVAKMMRAAGWQVCVSLEQSAPDVATLVSDTWFGIAGITLSSEEHGAGIARTIEGMRRGSRNSGLAIMAGGPAFNANPSLGAQVGADAVACDAIAAVILAKKLLLQKASRRAARA